MSRSYKKTPRSGDRKSKFHKRLFNRRIRKSPQNFKYNSYKKHSCSWDICDYEEIGTSFNQYWQQVLNSWYRFDKDCGVPYPDKDRAYLDYLKWFKRK